MTAQLNQLVVNQRHADLTRAAERARLAESARASGSTPERGDRSARRVHGRRFRILRTVVARLAGSPVR
jgi:hypothetical protein